MARQPEDLEAVEALMADSGNAGPRPEGPTPPGPPDAAAPPPEAGKADPQRLLSDIQVQLDQLRAMMGGLG